jgi:hypothetical protein
MRDDEMLFETYDRCGVSAENHGAEDVEMGGGVPEC